MFQTRSSFKVVSNIESLPFADLAESCKASRDPNKDRDENRLEADKVVKEFMLRFGIKEKTWVYPQVLARIGNWTLNQNTTGKYCALDLLKTNCASSPFDTGIYYFASSNERALAKQYSKDGAPFCKLVPLILAAFKKMRNIKYSEWDAKELSLVVHTSLWHAMSVDYYPFSKEDLLNFRQIGLTTASGKNAGKLNSASSYYGLNHLSKTAEIINPETGEITTVEGLGSIPPLARMMLCQTWCAHPSNRNQYMILDPKDWDSMPEPLIEANPIKENTRPTSKLTELPW